MKKQLIVLIVPLLLLLPILTGCNSVTASVQSMSTTTQQPETVGVATPVTNPSTSASVTLAKNETVATIESALEDIYSQVNPSVVSIQVTQKTEIDTPNFPTLPDFPGFRFFFGQLQLPQGDQPQAPQEFYQLANWTPMT